MSFWPFRQAPTKTAGSTGPTYDFYWYCTGMFRREDAAKLFDFLLAESKQPDANVRVALYNEGDGFRMTIRRNNQVMPVDEWVDSILKRKQKETR